MSQEDAYSFETMLSLIRVWVLLVIELLDRSKVLKVKLLSSQFPSSRYAEVYRPDLGQSTILRQASPEFHAAVVETGGFEAFARSSTLVSNDWG